MIQIYLFIFLHEEKQIIHITFICNLINLITIILELSLYAYILL